MSVAPRVTRPSRPPIAPRLSLENLEARDVPAVVGTLDPTFGTGGRVTADIGFTPAGVAVDSAGRAVVVGSATGPDGTQDFAVARFNRDGGLDTSFGSGGRTLINFTVAGAGQTDTANAVGIVAGDVIVVAGRSGPSGMGKFAVAELDAAGNPLGTFGTGGRVAYNIAGGGVDDSATGIVIDPRGRTSNIVVVGRSADAAGDSRFATSGISPTGMVLGTIRLAPMAGGDGKEDAATAAVNDAQGGFILAGQSRNTTTGNLQASVARFTNTGDLDTAFGTNGSVAVGGPLAGLTARALAVDTDAAGNIYLGIDANTTTTVDALAVAKLTPTGALDGTYGSGGVFISPFAGGGGQPGVVGLAVKPSGRVVAAGSSEAPGATNTDLLVLQLTPNGALDPSFNATGPNPGALFVDFAGNNDAARGFAITHNGRVVVAGTDLSTNKADLARVITTVELPVNLSVGGSPTGTARVYAPTGGGYANPPTAVTPSTVFGGFTGDVRTATGDFNGDGFPDTVMVTGPGTKTVMAVVSGKDNSILLGATDPFGDPNFTFGGFVAAGDIDHDGRAEWVVTPELRGGPRVIIFHLLPDGSFDLTSPGQPSLVANFFGIGDPSFRDGDRAALGDVNGDGILDVFSIAAFNGGPRTALYDGKDVLVARAAGRDPIKLVGDFFAAPSGQDEGRGGRSIAVGDVNGDGVADLIATGDNLLGTGNQVVVFSGADLIAGKFPGFGATPLANFTVSGQSPGALVSLATIDADGDNKADLAVGSGAGQLSAVKVYLGGNISGTAEPASSSLDPFSLVPVNGVFVG
jgi:uncharacterized delta-60 repeat protein